ncbi:MAG: LamG domain-containing protein, partial [Clostridiales bacterium]|nr:LamG domain-containing protein [Clostridiales bacterium]
MALVRTDYGLIYNTDGSLCATLLPEGGVAVTEGTTNIVHGKIIYDTTPPVPVPGYPNALAKYTTTTSDLVMTLDPEVQAHSVQAWVYMAEDWDYGTWEFRFLRNGSTVEMIPADPTKKGQWQHVKGTFTGSADQVQLRSRGSGTHQGRWTAMVQIEEKPFATSFVDGTRAAGRLEYPTSLLTGSWTLSAWLKRNYTGLYQGVAGFGSEGDSDFLYWILNYSGKIYWGLRVDGTAFFQVSWGNDPHINDTENWHHHVIQVDNDALKARYFLDGALFGEKALPSPVPPITKYQSFG